MLEITAKWSKTADVDVKKRLQQPMAIGRATAGHIKRRVLSGKTATRPEPYSTKPTSGSKKRPRYYVSEAYQRQAKAPKRVYKSSADFHRAVRSKAGTGHVTGGMWKGLQVRNYGKDAVVIEFARSSLGSSSVHTAILKKVSGSYEVTLSSRGKLRAKQQRQYSRDSDGNVKRRSKPKKVTNRAKAAAVYKHQGVGLLQPTRQETQAQLAAVADEAGSVVVVAFGGEMTTSLPGKGDRRLFSAIKRYMRRGS